MNAAVAPTPSFTETYRAEQRWVADRVREATQALRLAVRPLACLQLPEDATESPERMEWLAKAFPDDLQIEDNDLPLTYGDVRAARLAYSPWGVHPDIWDRYVARKVQP